MRKFVALLLTVTMLFSMSATAFAAEPENAAAPENGSADRISREAVEALFANKPAPAADGMSAEEEEALLLEILDQLQPLWAKQQQLIENGEDTTAVDNEIAALENRIDQMSHVTHLSDDQISTLGWKPTVPSDTDYVDCYSSDATCFIGGKYYDVFNIHAVSKRVGGFSNPLGYKDNITLMTDNAYTSNTFLKQVEAVAGFALSVRYLPFALADFLVLSDMPSFFDNGNSQSLDLQYSAQQHYIFSYVADQNSNWYDQTQTAEQLMIAETFTAFSTNNGTPKQKSVDRQTTLKSQNYANACNAAQLYATSSSRQIFYVGNLSYYYGGVKKGTIYTNNYSEPAAIPGLA